MRKNLLFASIFCLLTFTSCNNNGSKGENKSEATTEEKDSIDDVPDENVRPTGDERSVPEATSKDTTDTK